jgi:hypothetical protein
MGRTAFHRNGDVSGRTVASGQMLSGQRAKGKGQGKVEVEVEVEV